jgi:flavodoxin
MRSLVIYESMYGNTHRIAELIGEGLNEAGPATVVPIDEATLEMVEAADLVVVGGPTHVHGMSRPSTRTAAAEAASDDPNLSMDAAATGGGVREWLERLGDTGGRAAAFDTRVDIAPLLSGRASKGIAKHLRHHGFEVVLPPESFLVTKDTHLESGEEDHAREWGRQLTAAVRSSQPA